MTVCEVDFVNFSNSIRVELAYIIIIYDHVLVCIDFWNCDSLRLVTLRQFFDTFFSVIGVVLKRPRVCNFLSINTKTTVSFYLDDNHRFEDVLRCCHFHNL